MRAILLGPLAARDASALSFARRRLKGLGGGAGAGLLRVAVDGGLRAWQALGVEPHIAVGDWDSLRSRPALHRIPHLTLPRNKDRSDLFFACRAACGLGATELICLGVSGGRPDHHLAMLLDLSELEARLTGLRAVSVLGPDADYFFVSGRNSPLKLGLETGRTVSVFSLAGVAHGVTLRGFRFRPEGGTLGPSSHGLSNEVIQGEICRVGLRQGRLVVIAPPLKVT